MNGTGERLIFDQYSRYRRLAEILKAVPVKMNEKILDVGSGLPCLLEKFLSGQPITFLDPILESGSNGSNIRLKGDVWLDEVKDKRFDYVVTIDTLEHVKGHERERFLTRLMELAIEGVVIGCPFRDKGEAMITDSYINEIYKQFLGRDFNWLQDHIDYNLPSLKETLEILSGNGWFCQTFPNGHAPWMRKLLAYTLAAHDLSPDKLPYLLELSDYFNKNLYPYDNREPAYRYFILATRKKLDPAKIPQSQENKEWQKSWDYLEEQIKEGLKDLKSKMREEKVDSKQVIFSQSIKSEDTGLYFSDPKGKKVKGMGGMTFSHEVHLCRKFSWPESAEKVQLNLRLKLKSGSGKKSIGVQLEWMDTKNNFIEYGIPRVDMVAQGPKVFGIFTPPENVSTFVLKLIAPAGPDVYVLDKSEIVFLKMKEKSAEFISNQ